MNWKRLTVWILVLAALLGAWQYLERRGKSAKEAGDAEARLVPVAREAVTGITLKQGERTIALVRGADGWSLTAPVAWKADTPTVDSLLAAVIDGRVERVVAPPGTAGLAEFGLAPPTMKVEIVAGGGAAGALLVGGTAGVGGKTYVSRGTTGEVALAPGSLAEAVNAPVEDFRDRGIVSLSEAERIMVTRPGVAAAVVLAKEGGGWVVTSPFRDRADGKVADGLVGKLRELRIVSFVADGVADPKPWGLDKPALALAVSGKGKPEAALLLGGIAAEGSRYAMRRGEGTVFTVPGELAEAAPTEPDRYRDPSPLAFVQDDVRGIALTWSGAELSLSRAGEEWSLAGRPGYPVDKWEVRTLLTTLRELASETPPLSGNVTGKQPRLGEIVLTAEGGKVLDRLAVAQGRDGGVRTGSSDSRPGLLFAIPAAAAEKLAGYTNPFAVRKKEIFALDPGKADSLTVVAGGKTFRLERDGERWSLTEPSKRKLDDKEANDLLWDLGGVRATGIVAESGIDTVTYGLDKPALTVSGLLTGGGTVGPLTVGARNGDSYQVSAGDPAAVYLVPASTIDSILKAFAALNP